MADPYGNPNQLGKDGNGVIENEHIQSARRRLAPRFGLYQKPHDKVRIIDKMKIVFIPRRGKRKAHMLPLFQWADMHSLTCRDAAIERFVARRYRIKSSRARLFAGLAGLGAHHD